MKLPFNGVILQIIFCCDIFILGGSLEYEADLKNEVCDLIAI
jgi:hypothetical protein